MEKAEILKQAKALSRPSRACSYYRVDLHVHSPDSTDYDGDTEISAPEFMSAFVARGFDLIAITDHNTGTYIDKAVEACEQIASAEGNKIKVLPGVELNVSPGVHLLVILPEGGSAAISDLLSRLGLPVEHHGDTKKVISKAIGEIAGIVRGRGGLLIGAHCNSTKGVVDELKGEPRLEWLGELDALEINSGSTDDKVSRTVDYVMNELKVPLPFTFGSDSHNHASEGIGMWVKMADLSFTSLRQLTFESQLRVSRTQPDAPAHGRIVGFTTTHGMYANQRFRFSPHLNVLLGGRGAGKSAAIDLLRFAFEAEPRAGDVSKDVFARRIKGFLQAVGDVLVVAVGTDQNTYAITRSGDYEQRRGAPEFTQQAKVYQITDNDLIQREVHPLDVLGIEFYGQGEAARLADRVDEQLRLIDENLDHSDVNASISEAEQQLEADENRLIEHKRRLEELRDEAATRPRLEERRDRLEESLADPIFAERTRWDRERAWIQGQQDWTRGMADSLPQSIPTRSDVPLDIEKSSVKAVLEKVQEASERILESSGSDLQSLRKTLAEAVAEMDGYRKEWDTFFEASEEEYRARLAKLGAENLAEAAAEKRSVDEDLTRLETSVEPEIKRVESKVASLEARRATLLAGLRTAREELSCSRRDFVEELNQKLGSSVLIEWSGNDTEQYFDTIDNSLQGSGMHHREDQISLACEAFSPSELVEIIRNNAIDKLQEINITENNASRMIKALSDAVLYEMERVDVPKMPSIRIKREGEKFYTELTALSVGEKCSAILSIALLGKGKPLVIDQPEDDLDHAFIINSIVEGVRTAKADRQIVTATHNPNIPVLGDAEMVFRVARRAGEDSCYIQNSGGLELPQITVEVQSLEGGAEAFERRRQRYSGVLRK